jgi:hypothetical protein
LSIAAEDVLIAAIKTPAGTPSLWIRLGGLIGLLLAFLVWNRLESWSIPVIPESAFGPAAPVDERQQAVRDRSYRRAYQAVLLASLVSAVVAYILQEDLPGFLRRISESKLLLLVLLQIVLLLATLPVVCLAWTEPDETEGKPTEEMSSQESSAAGF